MLTNFFIPIEDDTQLSLRVSRSFLREKLDTTILGVLIRGDDQPGGIIRVDGSYELREALVLTSGFVFYLESDLPPLSTWGDNHRFFFELKWSF